MLRIALACCLVAACLGASPRLRRPRPDGRIVGGKETDIRNYPYQLSMEYQGSHLCGAAIVSEVHALTAAHCTARFSSEDVVFRAGSTTRGSGGTLHKATNIRIHDQYNSFEMDYDVSVVTVDPPFDLNSVSTILKKISLTTATPQPGAEVVITGWGVTSEGSTSPSETLQVVKLNVVDHQKCSDAYSAYGGVTGRMLCAGAAEGGKGACQGDSGSPVVDAGSARLVGIVSWGEGCGRSGYPGVHTDVYSVSSWIRNNFDL